MFSQAAMRRMHQLLRSSLSTPDPAFSVLPWLGLGRGPHGFALALPIGDARGSPQG